MEVLCRIRSDHSPLIIWCASILDLGQEHIFRFQAAWNLHPEYQPLAHRVWGATVGPMSSKLSVVKNEFVVFNKEVFGNIFHRKRHMESRLQGSKVPIF